MVDSPFTTTIFLQLVTKIVITAHYDDQFEWFFHCYIANLNHFYEEKQKKAHIEPDNPCKSTSKKSAIFLSPWLSIGEIRMSLSDFGCEWEPLTDDHYF